MKRLQKCLQKIPGKVYDTNPLENGITSNDRAIINELYGCKQIQFTKSRGTARVFTLWVHPEWDMDTLRNEMAAEVGGVWPSLTDWTLRASDEPINLRNEDLVVRDVINDANRERLQIHRESDYLINARNFFDRMMKR